MNHLYGIACVVMAAATFATLDTLIKYVGAAVPFAVVMWFRFGFQVITTAWWLRRTRGTFRLTSKHLRLQLYRGILLSISSIMAFFSLKFIPVADFTAIMMLTPLLMTVVAAVTLGEHISKLRWVLVGMGFVGAMVIIRPGHSAFTWGAVLPLLLVLTSAAYQLLTHSLASLDEPSTTHAYAGWIGFIMASVALPFVLQGAIADWQVASQAMNVSMGAMMGLLLVIAVCATAGHSLLILAYSHAPVTVLTPYLYSQIPFAVLGGWLLFAHALDDWTAAGVVIIAISGVLGTWLTAHERRLDLQVVLDN